MKPDNKPCHICKGMACSSYCSARKYVPKSESVSKKDIQALIDELMDEAMEAAKFSQMYLKEYSIGKSEGYKECINQLQDLLEPKESE